MTSRIADQKAPTAELARVQSLSPDPLVDAFRKRSEGVCRLAEQGNPLALRLLNNAYDLLAHGISHAKQIAETDDKINGDQ